MNARYRILYFIPDPMVDERVALGALVDTRDGLRIAHAAQLPAAPCVGSDLAAVAARMVAESMEGLTTYTATLPPFFSPQAILGREVVIPAQVEDPVAYVTDHVLPRRSSAVTRRPRAATRDEEGQRFFDNWGVGRYVKRHFRPRDFAAPERVTPMVDALPEVSQYVVGTGDLLLLEPIVASRSGLRKEARDVVQRFLAYNELQHRQLLRPATLIAYVLPAENPARTAEAMDLVRGAAHDVVDVGAVGPRDMLVQRVRTVGASLGLPNIH